MMVISISYLFFKLSYPYREGVRDYQWRTTKGVVHRSRRSGTTKASGDGAVECSRRFDVPTVTGQRGFEHIFCFFNEGTMYIFIFHSMAHEIGFFFLMR